MKKVVMFLILGLFFISLAGASKVNVTLIDDIGSFSGATLKIKSVGASSFGDDKIYASEYCTDVGIIRFEVETLFSEIDIYIRTTLDGVPAGEIFEGPFVVNGSEILIDKREKVEPVNATKVVTSVNESNFSMGVVENVSGSFSVEVGNDSVDVENFSNESKRSGLDFIGNVIFDDEGSINWVYSGGVIGVFLLLLVFIIMTSHRGKSKKESLDDSERELEETEKKVKDTEDRIKKIRDKKEKMEKINEAKSKLAEEEKELTELENEGDDEEIEAQEKVVEGAEDVVDEAEDND